MHKKLKVVAITIPFLLFTFRENHAHPLPEILLGIDFQSVEDLPTLTSDIKADTGVPRPAADLRGGEKKARARRRAPRQFRRRQARRSRRAGRNSAAQLAAKRLRALKREYARRARRPLVITSAQRTPHQQARAIRCNLAAYGERHILNTYRRGPAIREILRAYRANRANPRKAQREMTRVIREQVARGQFVSDHLLGRAVDVRSRGRNGARLSVLRQAARQVGVKVLVERDHVHCKLI